MPRDRQRLDHILDALDSLERILQGKDQAEFLSDEIVRYAVVQRLTVVGEAAAGVSNELRQPHPAIPWTDIVAFRNVAVHEYFGIHWPIVWVTATEQAPRLREQIKLVVYAGFPERSEK